MFSFRRKKGIRRRGRKRTPGRILLRFGIRVARPLVPGLVAGAAGSYYLDGAAGSARRKTAVARIARLLGKRKE
jgi:hypothetical protein